MAGKQLADVEGELSGGKGWECIANGSSTEAARLSTVPCNCFLPISSWSVDVSRHGRTSRVTIAAFSSPSVPELSPLHVGFSRQLRLSLRRKAGTLHAQEEFNPNCEGSRDT